MCIPLQYFLLSSLITFLFFKKSSNSFIIVIVFEGSMRLLYSSCKVYSSIEKGLNCCKSCKNVIVHICFCLCLFVQWFPLYQSFKEMCCPLQLNTQCIVKDNKYYKTNNVLSKTNKGNAFAQPLF